MKNKCALICLRENLTEAKKIPAIPKGAGGVKVKMKIFLHDSADHCSHCHVAYSRKPFRDSEKIAWIYRSDIDLCELLTFRSEKIGEIPWDWVWRRISNFLHSFLRTRKIYMPWRLVNSWINWPFRLWAHVFACVWNRNWMPAIVYVKRKFYKRWPPRNIRKVQFMAASEFCGRNKLVVKMLRNGFAWWDKWLNCLLHSIFLFSLISFFKVPASSYG